MPQPLRRIRIALSIFLAGLILSGLTAFPLSWELRLLCSWAGVPESARLQDLTGLQHWLAYVREGLTYNDQHYPFLAYGTDWLAFGHLMIAVFVFGAWLDPIRNSYIITAATIACLMIFPLALVCGEIRGIPFYWRLIDCSFGIFGIIPLLYVRRELSRLAEDASQLSRPS
jgi:hypothetical protein